MAVADHLGISRASVFRKLRLRKRPVAGRAAHDALLVTVAGRPFTRAAHALIKLARAREWDVGTGPAH